MRVGIFGGTFNPIHNSHLYLATEYKKHLELDRILLIPTYQPPHKQAKDLASSENRLEMCRLAAREYPFLEVNDYEVAKKDISYTYQTLEHLIERNPAETYFLIMGADMFLTFLDWKFPERIAQLAVLCTAPREEGEQPALLAQQKKLKALGMTCQVLAVTPKPLSSTFVRDIIKKGTSAAEYLPLAVWEYIKAHGLYQ